MKRAIFFISAIIIISSFSSQLLALPEGVVARLGIGNVNAVTFSPDGKFLAVASSIGIFLLDPFSLAEIYSFDTKASMASIAFSLDGSLLASGSGDHTIKLWDVRSRTLVATLEGHSSYVMSVAFSPDGSLLASVSNSTVKLWDVRSRTLVATLEGHSSYVMSVAFSPDGSLLASGGSDKTVKLWDVRSRTLVATLEGHSSYAMSVAFSPDGSLLASGGGYNDSTVKLWDVRNRTLVETLRHSDLVYSVAFSPDGTILASGSEDNTIKLWDLKSKSLITTLFGHSGWVYSVNFSPDGTMLASGSYGEIKLWDVKNRTNIATLARHAWVISVAFSPDGSLLASGSEDDIIVLRDVKNRTDVATLSGHPVYVLPSVYSVAFSPDGTMLASGSGDKTIRIWDVKSFKEIAILKGHSQLVSSVAFSPDGSMLASSSSDGAVLLWDMKPYIGQVPQQPNIVVSDKSYNFSDTPITTHSDWTFSISNAGNSDLKINGIDSDNPVFTVTPMAFPQDITPGKTLDVAVAFTPTDEKTYTGTLTIKSNDPDSPTITISLEGNGTVKHDKFSVGDYVKVINTGDSGLNIHKNDPTGEVLKVIPNGWLFKIIGGPKNNINGNNWWEIQEEKYEPSSINGWVAEDFLEKVS